MSFSDLFKKGNNGFHIGIELSRARVFIHLFEVKESGINLISSASASHNVSIANGMSQREEAKLSAVLDKLFSRLKDSVGKLIQRKKNLPISSVKIVLGPPWILTSGAKDLNLDQKDINEFLAGNIDLNVSKESGGIVVERCITSIRVNGYERQDIPLDNTGDINVSVIFYYIPTELSKILDSEVEFHTGGRPEIISLPRACSIYATSYSRSSSAVFIMVDIDSTLLVKVGRQRSERIGLSYSMEVINHGSKNIISQIAQESNSTEEAAISAIKLKNEGLLSEENSSYVQTAMEIGLSRWKENIMKAIDDLDSYNLKIISCRDSRFREVFRMSMGEHFIEAKSFEEIIFNKAVFNL